MKRLILSLCILLLTGYCDAQKVSLKKDTIMFGQTHYALFTKAGPMRYQIKDLTGQSLMELHNSRIELQGKPSYVLTFLNDRKQAVIIEQEHFPVALLEEIVKQKLITNGTIDAIAEQQFISTHPLPEGYTDVDQIINY